MGGTDRQQGDLIGLLTKLRREYTDRQQGDIISLLLLFQNKEKYIKS
jgi:hypothetical protein